MRRTSGPTHIGFEEDLQPGDVEIGPNGEAVLVQDFEVPEGAMAVRVQVGDAPVTIAGWVTDSDSVPDLFEDLAKQLRKMLAERGADAAPAETPE